MGRPKLCIEPGTIFGFLTIICETEAIGKDRRFVCYCVCGKSYAVHLTHLRSGATTSCGCQLYTRTAERMTTHGGSRSITYFSWAAMHCRCDPKNAHLFPTYEERKICDRWSEFPNFLKDMGERPDSDHELDRIENDLGYFPENCRWVTSKVNQRNRGNNLRLTMGSTTQPLSAWCEQLDLPYDPLYRRIQGKGMTLADAIKDAGLISPTMS